MPIKPGGHTPLSSQATQGLALAPGDVFSERFRIKRRLASGGVGLVYEAVHIWTTRRVALKFLRPERANEAQMSRRFQIEAEAATRVAHPNVAQVIDMGRDARTGMLYLAQELLDGCDLGEVLLARKRLPMTEAMAVMAPVMRALQAAHERGVLHRDLKPENIFLSRADDGSIVPKVIDFGLARLLSSDTRVTDNGLVNGTPCYMSPEQAADEPDLDARSDVWAVGVIWYELLAGRPPFTSTRIEALFASILGEEPEALHDLAPEVTPALSRVIHKALVKNRDQRFASMARFLDALTEALESAAPEVTILVPPVDVARPTFTSPPRPARGRAVLLCASAAILALLTWHIAGVALPATTRVITQTDRVPLRPLPLAAPSALSLAPETPATTPSSRQTDPFARSPSAPPVARRHLKRGSRARHDNASVADRTRGSHSHSSGERRRSSW